ncbi:hypothetical protein NDU88_002425 [Pleurodeles waltl]|uniref:Uncharacterized protein n=1 Tax=Pleurodeles waltl TaxID=8319 RepID=A0AAV7W399_PLEWA|nr:hypothetical protein NDU88_002425 [Pleurodeles waltl]
MDGKGIDLVTLPTLKINKLRALGKGREIVLGASAKKDDLEKALKAWDEAGNTQALLGDEITTESGDDDDNNDPFTEWDQESVVSTFVQGMTPCLGVKGDSHL